MKFAINIEYGNYNSKNRVLAFEDLYGYFRSGEKVKCKFYVNAIIKTTQDFILHTDIIQTVSDSCSVQYRPKGLHRNTKGVFYKMGGKPIYLSNEEVVEMESFIKECIKQQDKISNK